MASKSNHIRGRASDQREERQADISRNKNPQKWRAIRRRYHATIDGDSINVTAQNIGNPGDGVSIIVPLGTDYEDLNRAVKALRVLINTDFRAEQKRKQQIAARHSGTKNTEAEQE